LPAVAVSSIAHEEVISPTISNSKSTVRISQALQRVP